MLCHRERDNEETRVAREMLLSCHDNGRKENLMGFNPKWYSITERRPSIIHYGSCILPIHQTRIPSVTRAFSGIYQAGLDRKWVLYGTPARGWIAKTYSRVENIPRNEVVSSMKR